MNPDLVVSNPIWTWASTGSFSILVWSTNYAPLLCIPEKAPLVVEVINYQNPGNYNNLQNWPGQWNESLAIWAPQNVAFVLASNFVKYNVVQVQDYSNAVSGSDFPNSLITFTSGSTYTTSSSHCWSALWVFNGCSDAYNTIGSSSSWSATGHNLVVTENLWESGTVLFDAMDRLAYLTTESYYAAEQPPVNQPSTWPSGDNITASDAASNTSIYPIYSWGYEDGSQGRPVYVNSSASGAITVSSKSTVTGLVKGFSVDVGVSIYGVDLSTTVVTDQWSQTSTYTVSNTLSWTVYGNSTTVPICYAVYGVGGSSSSTGSTADAIGIWAFSPTLSGGRYSCLATQ